EPRKTQTLPRAAPESKGFRTESVAPAPAWSESRVLPCRRAPGGPSMTTMTSDKKADLAGPGISTYEEVTKILPDDYRSVLDRRETQIAIGHVKRFIEDGLCRALNLIHVEVPLIVTEESGVNDYLDRDGSRTPIAFPCGLGLAKRMDCQVVQAATKWKRM